MSQDTATTDPQQEISVSQTEKPPEDSATSPSINADGWINITEDGGIKKKILVPSEDPATPPDGSDVTCHYVGTLTESGEKFDSSRDRNSPFNFKLGEGRVIKCWDIGMKTLRRGEKAILRCTPEYGYGDRATGSIPANSSLDFEVELLDFDDMVKLSNGVRKRILVPGQGWDKPKEDGTVIFTYTARLHETDEKSTFDEEETCIWDMEEDDTKFFEGFSIAIRSMLMNEKALIKIPGEVAFGEKGCSSFASGIEVPPNATVYYEINLHSFDNGKEAFSVTSDEERLELAETHRTKGNDFFKRARFGKALKRYEKARDILRSNFAESKDPEIQRVMVSVDNNLSMVHIKLKNYEDAIRHANDVLEFEPENIKALTRRGHANMLNGENKQAKRDLTKALSLEPNNEYIQRLLKQCKKNIKKFKAQQKKIYEKMFS